MMKHTSRLARSSTRLNGLATMATTCAVTALVGLVTLLSTRPALACSVCAGGPNTALSQGAQAGMLVLLGVIGVVLAGLASLLIFWGRRAAYLHALDLNALNLEALNLEALDLEALSLDTLDPNALPVPETDPELWLGGKRQPSDEAHQRPQT